VDLEFGDLAVVGGEELAHEVGGVLGGVDLELPVLDPLHLGGGRGGAGELVGRAVGDDAPAREDEDPLGQLLGLVEVVGGEQDRGAVEVGEPVDELVELPARVRVEPGGRLVQEQQGRAADDAEGHVEAAALPAREGLDPLPGLRGEADHVEQLLGAPRLGVGPVVVGEVRHDVAHLPLAVVAPLLEHDAEPGAPGLVAAGRVDAEHLHVAVGAAAEALEDLDGGGLAGAVGAEQGGDPAGFDLEVESGEHRLGAVAHAQIGHDDRGPVATRWRGVSHLHLRCIRSFVDSTHTTSRRRTLSTRTTTRAAHQVMDGPRGAESEA
jgi:hypothetical protein